MDLTPTFPVMRGMTRPGEMPSPGFACTNKYSRVLRSPLPHDIVPLPPPPHHQNSRHLTTNLQSMSRALSFWPMVDINWSIIPHGMPGNSCSAFWHCSAFSLRLGKARERRQILRLLALQRLLPEAEKGDRKASDTPPSGTAAPSPSG